MRAITLLFLLAFSQLTLAVTISNKTNKTFALNIPDGGKIIIQENETVEVDDFVAEGLQIVLAVSIASVYKIQDLTGTTALHIEEGDSEAVFNMQTIPPNQGYHPDLSQYETIALGYWDASKEDDALLLTFTKKPTVALMDAVVSKLDVKCTLF